MKSKFILSALALSFTVGAIAMNARAEESIQSKLLTLVSKMNAEQQQALYTLLTTVSGPDTSTAAAAPAAPSAETALADNIKKIQEAAINGNLDGVMALVADDFQQSQLGGKDALKTFLGALVASGDVARYAKETTISTSRATIKSENNKASIDPIEVSGPWGSATLSFTAKLVGNEWKITGAEVH